LSTITDVTPELLEAKEQELNNRDAYVGIQEQNIKDGLDIDGKKIRSKPNWPICCPFLYHSLLKGTKKGFPRVIAVQGYIAWFILMVILFLNLGVAIATVCLSVNNPTTPPVNSSTLLHLRDTIPFDEKEFYSIQQGSGSGSAGFIIPQVGFGVSGFMDIVRFIVSAILQFILVIPLHFYLCYWPLYKCMCSPITPRFIIFFFSYVFFGMIFDVFEMSGFYQWGATGFWVSILYFPTTATNGNIAGIVINGVMFLLWFALLVIHCFIYLQVFIVFRNENYYMKRLGTYIKTGCLKLCIKATDKPKPILPVVDPVSN